MSSYSTKYRREHPEYAAIEKIKTNERVKNLYNNNPEYREKTKQNALNRYYRIKQQKIDALISMGIDPFN